MSQYKFTIVGKDGTKAMFRSIKTGLKGVRAGINSTQVKFAGLAGIAGIGAIVNANREAIDSLAKTSDRLNITTQDLAAFRHMAELSGASNKVFDDSLEKMVRNIGQAQRGFGTARNALQGLGIDVDNLAKMDAGKQFETIAEAISGVEDRTQQASLAADIFGRSGTQLINTLDQGAEGIAKARDEVERYGLAMTRVDAAKVEQANDQLTRVGAVVKGLGQKVTVQLAPVLAVAAEKFIGVATQGDRMGKVITGAMNFAVKAVGIFANGIRGIQVIVKGVQLAFEAWKVSVSFVYRSLTLGAVKLGQAITDAVVFPLRAALEIGAKFSDTSAQMLRDLNRFATIEPPNIVGFFDGVIERSSDNVERLRGELHDLMMADLPSAVIEQKWDEINAEVARRARETAQTAANAAQGLDMGAEDTATPDAREQELEAAKLQRERERVAAQLQRLDEQYFTELEKLEAKYQRELEVIQAAEDAKAITESEAQSRRMRAETAFENQRTKLAAAGESARSNIVSTGLTKVSNLVGSKSRKMFRVQKAAALAQAAVALPAAVVEAIKNAGGLPWGAWAGALTAAQGAAQIASIRSQSIGGGGSSVPSVSGAASGVAGPAPAAIAPSIGSQFTDQGAQRDSVRPQVVINIAGDVNGDQAESIIDGLRTKLEDEDVVLFGANSRQALELQPTG